MDTKKHISAVIIGAGDRGKDVYGLYALNHPEEVEIVAIAEPHPKRREELAKAHSIPIKHQYKTWEKLLDKVKLADAAFICTQDQMHTKPTLKALSLGYHVLLEKPMATEPEECVVLIKKAKEVKRQLHIAHVLRYTPFFTKIHQILKSGKLGEIITIDHRENVSYWHMAHSFVRGNWAVRNNSSPMILAKSVHDLDILSWLVEDKSKYISSFGSLKHFKKENAPLGATKRCLDGCMVTESCKYFAPRIYIDVIPLMKILQSGTSKRGRLKAYLTLKHPKLLLKLRKLPYFHQFNDYRGWPISTISEDLTIKGKWDAIKTGPYGRCVYFSNNDVVDHQITAIEFENGVTATFTMHGFSHIEGRTIRIDGTKGTLIGEFTLCGDKLVFYDHLNESQDLVSNKKFHPKDVMTHGGGDQRFIKSFINSLLIDSNEPLTSAKRSLESHLMAFAAEESRLTNKIIQMNEFRNRFRIC